MKPGHEEQFFAAWTAAKEPRPLQGVRTAPRLLRDLRTAGRYVSFAEFESLEAIEAFRSRPDFDELIGAMRDHLNDLKISTFEQGHRTLIGVEERCTPSSRPACH